MIRQLVTLDDGHASLLSEPYWVTTSRSGRFVVADPSDKDVKIYDRRGMRLLTVGRAGDGADQFSSMIGAASFGDSIAAGDFVKAQVMVFDPRGTLARTVAINGPSDPKAISLRVVDDSLLLLNGSPLGSQNVPLVSLETLRGTLVARLFQRSSYFDNDPALIQYSTTFADATDGCVFVMSGRSDSLFAFDYKGRSLGSGSVDEKDPLPSLKRELRDNQGRVRRPDGTWVFDGDRVVAKVVAGRHCRAVLQIITYHADGTDPMKGGTLLVLTPDSAGGLRSLARVEIGQGLVGRDDDGNPLLASRTATGSFALSELVPTQEDPQNGRVADK